MPESVYFFGIICYNTNECSQNMGDKAPFREKEHEEREVACNGGRVMEFKLHSPFQPTGDQPQAIEKLTEGVLDGIRTQVLVGVTGSGKTFTMANVIKNVNRPTLVIAHNKTLAAQLCNEFREFFPENRVEYFVSYYDYYQPESYIPSTDTYIEKDLSLNDEIDKLRNSATCSLMERRDVLVVASVSCIYGLGAPEEYFRLSGGCYQQWYTIRKTFLSEL